MAAINNAAKKPSAGLLRFRAMEWIESLPISPSDANVMLYLAHRIDAKSGCFPSRGRIAVGTKLSERTISRTLKSLEHRGILIVERTRNKNGNRRFKNIELCIPEAFLSPNKTLDDTVSLGPSDSLSDPSGEPSDTVAHGSIQLLDKYSEEEKKEPKMGVTEALGYTPESNLNSNIGKEKTTILITTEHEQPLLAGIGTLLHPLNADYEFAAFAGDTKPLLEGCVLVSRYTEACAKGSPKARVAFWHQLGRTHYPNLPRFAQNHKLPNGQSKDLHQIFDAAGRTACPMLASVFANWRCAVVEASYIRTDSSPPKVPETEYISSELKSFLAFWAGEFQRVEFKSSVERNQILARLGVNA